MVHCRLTSDVCCAPKHRSRRCAAAVGIRFPIGDDIVSLRERSCREQADPVAARPTRTLRADVEGIQQIRRASAARRPAPRPATHPNGC